MVTQPKSPETFNLQLAATEASPSSPGFPSAVAKPDPDHPCSVCQSQAFYDVDDQQITIVLAAAALPLPATLTATVADGSLSYALSSDACQQLLRAQRVLLRLPAGAAQPDWLTITYSFLRDGASVVVKHEVAPVPNNEPVFTLDGPLASDPAVAPTADASDDAPAPSGLRPTAQ